MPGVGFRQDPRSAVHYFRIHRRQAGQSDLRAGIGRRPRSPKIQQRLAIPPLSHASSGPLDAGGQFCDRGYHYRSAIFVAGAEQGRIASAAKKKVAASLKKPVAALLLPASAFYPAEAYHQNYYKKNPIRYCDYRTSCGRDARLSRVWSESSWIENWSACSFAQNPSLSDGGVIQPGGAMRDQEVIAAADKAGLAMVFTGMRHFRHLTGAVRPERALRRSQFRLGQAPHE